MNEFYFTDLIDFVFEIWNTDLGVQMFGIGVFCCVLGLFLRLLKGGR